MGINPFATTQLQATEFLHHPSFTEYVRMTGLSTGSKMDLR
jgi:hypothetical protein